MEEIRQKDIDWLLNLDKDFAPTGNSSEQVSPKEKPAFSLKKGLSYLLVGALALLLPFYLLVRISVYMEQAGYLGPWTSLLSGTFSVVMLLSLYIFFLFRKVENRKRVMKYAVRAMAVLVSGFCLYGLFYMSSLNAKSEEIRSVYRSLHPVMRVAVSTITLADNGLVVTDISRTPEDYADMGLPVNQRSLHFRQESGFVHAIDLRTVGQPEWRNVMIEKAFNILGISTIRHVGTADHLHVYLPVLNPS